jgi:FixJ family two-component response regulator
MYVAIVDDDASVRTALSRRLRAAGLSVRTYSSATDFLTTAQPREVACMILDVHLGGMSGFDLSDYLRSLGWDMPIIPITAHDEIPTAELERYAGAAGYLRKPFDSDELVALVRRALALGPRVL